MGDYEIERNCISQLGVYTTEGVYNAKQGVRTGCDKSVYNLSGVHKTKARGVSRQKRCNKKACNRAKACIKTKPWACRNVTFGTGVGLTRPGYQTAHLYEPKGLNKTDGVHKTY